MRILRAAVLVLCATSGIAQMPSVRTIPAGPYRIAGTVVNATSGEALSHARVAIADTKHRNDVQTLITDEEGHFEFQVPGGKFSLVGSRKGFVASAYDPHDNFATAIVTGAGIDTEDLKLKLPPNAVLSGKVYDENGEPVRHAVVLAYREMRNTGIAMNRSAGRSESDDQGQYAIENLPPGTYFLSVRAEPWYAVHPARLVKTAEAIEPAVDPALDVVYPVLYYSDTFDADEATPIPLRGGEHANLDFHLSPVPALHLLWHSNPKAQTSSTLELLQKGLAGEDSMATGYSQISQEDGTTEVTGLAPGTYQVQVPSEDGEPSAPVEMQLGENDHELPIGERAQNVATLKITVEVPGVEKLPPHMQAALRDRRGRNVRFAELDGNEQATWTGITPGEYETLVGNPSGRFAVTSIAKNGKRTEGHTLQIGSGESSEVVVTAIQELGSVEGRVVRDGKPQAGAMVVLVPRDPENHHELFRRDQSDLDGTFVLLSVIPGEYTIMAIEGGWDLDWARPAVIASYGKKGQKIRVETRDLKLKEDVEAVGK